VDKNNEIYTFRTTNVNRELNTAIRISFENYPIEKLNIENIDQGIQYNLYIVSKKRYKNIFNYSNSFPFQTAPSFNNSLLYSQYPDKIQQFKNEVKEQFICNFGLIPDKKTNYLRVKYKITKNGKFIHEKKSKNDPKEYLNEIDGVFNLIKKQHLYLLKTNLK
jgi:hypothetical protein